MKIINRIRYFICANDRNRRVYALTRIISSGHHWYSAAGDRPCTKLGLTPEAVLAVSEIIDLIDGVRVSVSARQLDVYLLDAYLFDDFHEEIVDILIRTIFKDLDPQQVQVIA